MVAWLTVVYPRSQQQPNILQQFGQIYGKSYDPTYRLERIFENHSIISFFINLAEGDGLKKTKMARRVWIWAGKRVPAGPSLSTDCSNHVVRENLN